MDRYTLQLNKVFFCVVILISQTAVMYSHNAFATACSVNGIDTDCYEPKVTDWTYRLCDKAGSFNYRYRAWCEAGGGTWYGSNYGCSINIIFNEENIVPFVSKFADILTNTEGSIPSDSGWGITYTDNYLCNSGQPTYANDILISDVRQLSAPGATVIAYRSRKLVCGEGATDITLNQKKMCVYKYIAAVPQGPNPPPSCDDRTGNPIVISSGAKIQKEADIYSRGKGQIGFERIYNNEGISASGSWYHSYQKSLRVITPEKITVGGRKSSPYTSKALACSSGWSQIRSSIEQSWAIGTSAQYLNDTCQIKLGNTFVRNIPILPNANIIQTYIKPGSVQIVQENGSTLSFGLAANDEYIGLSGENGQLISFSDASPITWRYRAGNGDVEDYNADGKLLSITASNGIKQELLYDSITGLLASVKDSAGGELLFAYTGNQISSVTVDGNKTTSYAYNSLGLITQVTRPDSTTRIYHYEDTRFPTYLTGITDERGKRYATWTYDAQGRAISSEHASGAEKTLLAFNADGSTTVTNALNKQTIYRFAEIAGARRVTKVEGQPTANCVGANQVYTYTNEGWIASKTDWKGIKTTYQYNTLGQETSRTEAFGTSEARTITTEWHPTLFVKTKVTEPEKETTYSYDSNGRLLSQSSQSITL